MTGFVFSPAAQADVDSIWDYTADRWSVDQADRYTDDFRDACRELAAGRRIGQPVAVRPGYRKCPVGSHILYYRVDDRGIVVVRILHARMDAGRHLA